MKIFFFLFLLFAFLVGGGISALLFLSSNEAVISVYPKPSGNFWEFRSIDTMKHSRDLAREKLHDASYDAVIDREVRMIAETGATHVAIATPYDEEFVPYLFRWVDAARRHDLCVWFRGNFSGWEEWFGYSSISREEHLRKMTGFISKHPDLFQDGDAFSTCPECENGGPGDPRQTGDVSGYQNFLIEEYEAANTAFEKIEKRILTHFFSMNGDVARLVMDRETTLKLGGIVTVDHYVKTPEKLASDAEDFVSRSDGRLVLGEFGAPIPDIHGAMSAEEQAVWLEDTLSRFSRLPNIFGMNYWAHVGSSTALWDDKGNARKAVGILSKFYRPRVFYGVVSDELGTPIAGARVMTGSNEAKTNREGYFELRAPIGADEETTLSVSASGFLPADVLGEETQLSVALLREHETKWFKLQKWMKEHMRN